MVHEDLILLYQEALDMLPESDIRCGTAHCSGSCTDAALPPQEVPSNMLSFHNSYIYSHCSYYGRNVRCILRKEPPTNGRPTKFKDPDVTARSICVRGSRDDVS
jgi:hypothetical protein